MSVISRLAVTCRFEKLPLLISQVVMSTCNVGVALA